jgi:cation diffusion facilitator CzcD-associated flavoprotein CzcO
MEETAVVIVGAGPSGLAMGLALAKYRIQVRSQNYIFLRDADQVAK